MKKLFNLLAMTLVGIMTIGLAACAPSGGNSDGIEVYPNSLSFGEEGGIKNVIITGEGWTRSASEDWIILADIAGGISVEVEPSTDERSGFVIISHSSGSRTITVLQNAPAGVAPTNLTATGVSFNEATLAWQHPDADSFELVINDGDAITLTATEYQANDLTPETTYRWKVRAGKDGAWSAWAESEFTTKPQPEGYEFEFIAFSEFNYAYDQSKGLGLFSFTITTFGPEDSPTMDDWNMNLALVSGRVDQSPDKEWYDIPTGTYTVSTEAADNVVKIGNYETSLYDAAYSRFPKVTGGTVTVEGDKDNYIIIFDFITDENGSPSTFKGYFVGSHYMANWSYFPNVDELEFTSAQMRTSYLDTYYVVDYYLNLYDDGAIEDGNGFRLALDLNAPGSDLDVIPDGTYTPAFLPAEWTYSTATTLFVRYVFSAPFLSFNFDNGEVKTTRTGEDTYKVEVNFLLENGVELVKTFTGYVEPVISPLNDSPKLERIEK